MSTHNLEATSESDLGITFTCSTCGAVCEFQHEPASPSPTWSGTSGLWLPPANPEQWMGPCT